MNVSQDYSIDMAKTLVWKDLSMRQVYDYQSLQTPQESLQYLQSIFKLDNSERSSILLDLYYYTLRFAKENEFSPNQTSAFFSIVKETHSNAIASPLINLEKDFAFFKNLLLQHSIQRPPKSAKVFSFNEMKSITDYVTHTYFRHYMMYKYAFTKKLRLDFVIENFMPAQGSTSADASHEEVSGDATGSTDANGGVAKDPSSTQGDAASGSSNLAALNGATGQSSGSAAPGTVNADGTAVADGHAVQADNAASGTNDNRAQTNTSVAAHPSQQASASAQQNQQSGAAALNAAKDTTKILAEDAISDKFGGSNPSLAGEAPKTQPNKRDAAISEVRSFISSVLTSKLEEIRNTLQSKLTSQEDMINAKLRKIEGGQDDDKDKKKDSKPKPKK